MAFCSPVAQSKLLMQIAARASWRSGRSSKSWGSLIWSRSAASESVAREKEETFTFGKIDARGVSVETEGTSTFGKPRFGEKVKRQRKFPDMSNRGMKLSVEEALYLAKEAGYWTTREVQMQIVRSPPFSPGQSPFLLENFYEVADYEENEQEEEDDDELGEDAEEQELKAEDKMNPVIQGTIEKHFRPDQPAKFWHNDEEWLSEAEGVGTRRRASAHVVIKRGTGLYKVNGESDMFSRWPLLYMRFDVCQPFKLTDTSCVYDVFVETRGGGPSGQAGATRLAVSRALLAANPNCHDRLQKAFCLMEDTRQQWSKMPGKAGRTASFSWSRR
jgi:ribosomal protein S9